MPDLIQGSGAPVAMRSDHGPALCRLWSLAWRAGAALTGTGENQTHKSLWFCVRGSVGNHSQLLLLDESRLFSRHLGPRLLPGR